MAPMLFNLNMSQQGATNRVRNVQMNASKFVYANIIYFYFR